MLRECKESLLQAIDFQHCLVIWPVLNSESERAKHPNIPFEMIAKGLVRYFYSLTDSSVSVLSPSTRILVAQLNLLIKHNIFNDSINLFLSHFVADILQGGRQTKAYMTQAFSNDIDAFISALNEKVSLEVQSVQVPLELETGCTEQEANQSNGDRPINRAIKIADNTKDLCRRYEIYAYELQLANEEGGLTPDDLACFQLNLAICAMNSKNSALFAKHIRETLQTIQAVQNKNEYLKELQDRCCDLLKCRIIEKTFEDADNTDDERAKYEIFTNGLNQATKLAALKPEDIVRFQYHLSECAGYFEDRVRQLKHLVEVFSTIKNNGLRTDYLREFEEKSKNDLITAVEEMDSKFPDNSESRRKLLIFLLHLARENNRAPLKIHYLLSRLASISWDMRQYEKYIAFAELAIRLCDQYHDECVRLLEDRDRIASDLIVGFLVLAIDKLSEEKLDQANQLYHRALDLLKVTKEIVPSDVSKIIKYLFVLVEKTTANATKEARYAETLAIAKKLNVENFRVALGQEKLALQALHQKEYDKSIALLRSALETLMSAQKVKKENIAAANIIKYNLATQLVGRAIVLVNEEQENTLCSEALKILNTIEDLKEPERDIFEKNVVLCVISFISCAKDNVLKNKHERVGGFYQEIINLLKVIKVKNSIDLSTFIQDLFWLIENTPNPDIQKARYEQLLVLAEARAFNVCDIALGQKKLAMQAWSNRQCVMALNYLFSARRNLNKAPKNDIQNELAREINFLLLQYLLKWPLNSRDDKTRQVLHKLISSLIKSIGWLTDQEREGLRIQIVKLFSRVPRKKLPNSAPLSYLFTVSTEEKSGNKQLSILPANTARRK